MARSKRNADGGLSEAYIQKKCVEYAESKGYWARKFSSPGNNAVPDVIFAKHFFFHRPGEKWLEEFKAEGKTPSVLQLREHERCRAAGWRVEPSTGTRGQLDIDDFKTRIDAMEDFYAS